MRLALKTAPKNPLAVVALACATLLGAMTLLAPPASAHAGLLGSDPAAGERLATAPSEVSLDFNEDIREPAYVVVTVDGEEVQQGSAQVAGGTVTQAIAADAPAGDWTMAFRVVSVDGHAVTDEIDFSVDAPASAPTAEPSPDPTDAQTPADETQAAQTQAAAPQAGQVDQQGLWARHGEHVVVGAALLAVAAAVLLLARRRTR